ncbi:hypothetical protein RND81_05G129900 [Saponaria officinalis]|uniref:Rhodanese domain-containing protein n=1 Tax=Saponaria officinalis TaxID=3572 RepID=A0AAW1L0K6_SAPOF
MLPVCSATSCSSHSQILLNDGLRFVSRSRKALDVTVRWDSGDTLVQRWSSGISPEVRLQKDTANSLYVDFLGGRKPLTNEWSYGSGTISDSGFLGGEHLIYVEDSTAAGETVVQNADVFQEPSIKETASMLDNFAEGTTNVLDASGMITKSLDNTDSFESFTSQTNGSIGESISKVENVLNSSVEKVTSAITDIIQDGNEAIEKLTNKVFSTADQTGELTRNGLSRLPGQLKEATSTAIGIALGLLRKTIVVVEDSLVKGSKSVYYAYEASKEFLPPELQNALDSFEEKTSELSKPVAMVFVQAYSVIEGLERSLGLDPSDPVLPFVIFLGTASTLWTIYWVVTYSGYAGDLSPKSALELLKGKDSAVLIDVRSEDMKQQDGIPDLRRSARFRYADVSLLKVDDSLRKLMKSNKDLDDALIASVIRNLKNVQDRSKVIVMDADGSQAKSIARSLRKLGIKRPYVLQGGFQSWVKEGLRAKELKTETVITILNEEAEAILEELSPSPVQLLGFGVGSIAALYAILEWEKSLQFIGVIGIVQTIYRRVASYEDSEDFSKDVRSLLSPVTMGAQALTWATGKVETNGNGLPVSPSSTDVQSRVLQAAAKHESQPFDDAQGSPDSLTDSTTEFGGNADPSEA